MTDLPNRAAFSEHLAAAVARARTSGENFAVLCVDLDRFKEVNDIFGHPVGDALLRAVARRLQAAAEGAIVARIGGDEFTLISTGEPQIATAEALADRLHAAFADDFDVEGQQLRMGLSIGIAIYPTDGADETALIANADAALYRAKAEGRGKTSFFDIAMDTRLHERRALQLELRSALPRDEFSLVYQPQSQMNGEMVGMEALVRWKNPTRGTVSPGMFIPLAEESGLIIPIGEWILREACREAASWPRPLGIAVNISPIQFRHGDLPGLVLAVLLETGLPRTGWSSRSPKGSWWKISRARSRSWAVSRRSGCASRWTISARDIPPCPICRRFPSTRSRSINPSYRTSGPTRSPRPSSAR